MANDLCTLLPTFNIILKPAGAVFSQALIIFIKLPDLGY